MGGGRLELEVGSWEVEGGYGWYGGNGEDVVVWDYQLGRSSLGGWIH